MKTIASPRSTLLRGQLRIELVKTDQSLGLGRESMRCVALLKEHNDDRPWHFHADF
jgi:hypothetical protein